MNNFVIGNRFTMKTKILPGRAKIFLPALLISISFLFHDAQSQNKKRVALVIGAQTYTVLPPLRNAVSDAKAMATALQTKGFQVEAVYNPKTQKDIKDAITRYYNLMKDQVDAVGVIFYAGHGMQLDGINYIIPTSATLQIPGDLDDQCVKMNTVMSVLKASSSSLNILLLDACRTLPSFSRDSEQGWSKMDAPRGSIIVFATEAGKTASDGTGKNGLFTSKFLKAMEVPGLNITDALKRVKREVFIESNEKQLPSVEDNSIGADFFFTPLQTAQVTTSPSNTASAQKPIETKKEVVTSPTTTNTGDASANAEFVKIGSQLWGSKNLNVDQFANGETIAEVKTPEDWIAASEKKQPAWSYYENKTTNGASYGRLYNWYAVVDSKGLCPTGSHVGTDKDWASLISFLGKDPAIKIRAASWQQNENSSDALHFSASAAGMRFGNGKFGSLDIEGYWWTSTEASSSYASGIFIGSVSNAVSKRSYKKENGFAVRCVKD